MNVLAKWILFLNLSIITYFASHQEHRTNNTFEENTNNLENTRGIKDTDQKH